MCVSSSSFTNVSKHLWIEPATHGTTTSFEPNETAPPLLSMPSTARTPLREATGPEIREILWRTSWPTLHMVLTDKLPLHQPMSCEPMLHSAQKSPWSMLRLNEMQVYQ